MNVASKSLCRELCGLSGWGGTDYIWNGDALIYQDPEFKQGEQEVYPAYDLGYLLQKLPPFIEKHNKRWEKVLMSEDTHRWCAGYCHMQANDWLKGIMVADTPEDAACSLAIELFKQGILK